MKKTNIEENKLRNHLPFNKRGVTLIELLVALVIGGIVVAGIYRVFIAQSKAYTVQDQVVEVQQNIRSAMEILLRDLRMAGYNGNRTPSKLLNAICPGDFGCNVMNDAVRIEYVINGALNTMVFFRNAVSAELMEDLYVSGIQQAGYPVALLENVDALTFTYGVDGRIGLDETQDGTIDDFSGDGNIDNADFVPAATANSSNLNIIAVQVALTARPTPVNPDIPKMVQPRTLVSAITLRNLCLLKTN
jgi:prepilin-type N-terminal cleavage/methylation domain-containing protein